MTFHCSKYGSSRGLGDPILRVLSLEGEQNFMHSPEAFPCLPASEHISFSPNMEHTLTPAREKTQVLSQSAGFWHGQDHASGRVPVFAVCRLVRKRKVLVCSAQNGSW